MAGIRTIGLSGFSREDETALRDLFDQAAVPGWQLVGEKDASALLIDFDSMYGQMAWLTVQNSGKPVAAVTVAQRASTDYLLQRPVTRDSLAELLQQMSDGVRARPAAAPAASAPPAADVATPTEPPTAALPAEAAAPPPAQSSGPPAPAAPRERRLLDYLEPKALPGPAALSDADPALLVDVDAGTYVGGAALKPLTDHCRRNIQPGDWKPVAASDYAAMQASHGGAQPLNRLRWLAGLCAYEGNLAPDLAGASRFKLGKWPQSEREFPKHFRIATALLKQPGSIDEVAATSGAGAADVIDFINACHAIGIIEAEFPASPGATPDAGRGGLMGRLRGRPG